MTNRLENPRSRRQFIKTVAAGAAGAGLAMRMPASSYARIRGANDRVRVGIVGYSDRTRSSLIPSFLQNAKELNFDIVAVSDIWNRRREEGAGRLSEQTGHQVTAYRNNEELYEAQVTDAVIIGTADFQHALHAVEAVRAGQDAYVEKPFANTMEDNNLALDVVTASDRIIQVGTQRRSAPNYMMANEFLKSGRFGDIVMAEMTWNVNQPGRWRRPQLVSEIKESDTDWQRYLMNRPYEPWDPRKYLEYRLFWPYSSGIPDQWMVHQIDTVHWFTDLPWPRSVVANGGIYLWRDGRSNHDTMTAVFDYGPFDNPNKGFQVVYSSRMTNEAGGVKEYYYSNGGMLNLDTNSITPDGGLAANHARAMNMEPNQLPTMTLSEAGGLETAADTGSDPATTANVRNWMECIRSRQTPNADIHAGYNHSVALCMTIAALQTGKRVTFDADKRDVVAS
jgi:predicted dehydrogenase